MAKKEAGIREVTMRSSELGKVYQDGEIIVRQGEPGASMYVIQKGKVEILHEQQGNQIRLSVLSDGDVFGEMALFGTEPRSATVRAIGEVRALTIDKKTFLRRIHEDPSLAFRILQKMSQRIRQMDSDLASWKSSTTDRKPPNL